MKNNDSSMDFINDLTRKLMESGQRAYFKNGNYFISGSIAPDGSIYLGHYNNKDWFVTAQNAKYSDGKNMVMAFNAAAQYAKDLRAHGHDDWMVPPGKNDPKEPDILKEMYKNENTGAFAGTYEKETYPDRWYWSSTRSPDNAQKAWRHSFYINRSDLEGTNDRHSVRPVRAVPRPK
jgi:hypothetical protein